MVHPLDLMLRNAIVNKVLFFRSNSMFHLLTRKFRPVNPKFSKGAGKLVHYQKFAVYHTFRKKIITVVKCTVLEKSTTTTNPAQSPK